MEFDVLKKILKEKLEILSSNLEQEEQKIEEIEKLQSIIRKIKDDPYILYTSTDDNFINSLGFSSDELSMIDKCKKIYEGFLLFGREAIPQISIVEENTLKIQTDLEKKIYFLSDVAAKHQGTILSYQEYERLGKEVFSDDQYITQVDALINLLNSTDLIEYDKNRIKMAVIDRNNSIYRNLKKSLETKDDVIEEVAVSDTIISEDNVSDNSFQQLIDVITINLENKFGPDALKRIESISDLLKECKVKEEIDALLEGWEYSLGAPFSEIIDAVISVKNIEILELKDAFGADSEEIRDEVDFLNKQISSLNDYKAEISFEKNLDSTEVSVDMNEYEKAIYEYNSDPYASPNCVLFINNSIGRDIDAIKDKETLQDLFLLIEQMKKGSFQSKNFISFEDVREVKPTKKGRQARIRYVALNSNTFVILQAIGSKSNKYRGEIQTLKSRHKEFYTLSKNLKKDDATLDNLANLTKLHSEKLVSMISNTHTNKVGGIS